MILYLALPGSVWVTGYGSFDPGYVGFVGGVWGHAEPHVPDYPHRRGRACHFGRLSAQPELSRRACAEPGRSGPVLSFVEACAEPGRSKLALPNQDPHPKT